MQVCIETMPDGYRRASFESAACGAVLIVRPDGSESWTNVQPDSPLYTALNAALFAPGMVGLHVQDSMASDVISCSVGAGFYSGRFFESAEAAAAQFQYAATLRAANSREKKFSPMHRAQMQREAAALYLAARDAITTGA